VTGLGVVCALGHNVADFWDRLIAGACGITPIDLFSTEGYRTKSAAQIKDLDWDAPFAPRLRRRLSRCDRLAVLAAREALASAGLNPLPIPAEHVAVVLGGGAGGMLSAEIHRERILKGKPRQADPNLLLSFGGANISDAVAADAGAAGPRTTVVTACSSSATSIGYAADLIRDGRCNVAIAGGSDAMSRLTFAGFNALRSVDPDRCRPFDLNRKGLSLGEGAAMLILEDYEHAIARSATILAEFGGYAITCDAYHMTAPEPSGDGAARCMAAALADAGLTPADIGYINAHGTATRFNDIVETTAIKQVFGDRANSIPVSSIKAAIGHCLGAAGCIETLALVLALQQGILPPTINYETPDPACDLDYIPNQARRCPFNHGLTNSFAFGGNNTSIIMSRFEPVTAPPAAQSEVTGHATEREGHE